MGVSTFLIQCLNAAQYGLLLFLVASGLTLIFGAMGIINLAHGSFYMVGAYMAYALAPAVAQYLHGGFFTTLLVGLLISIVLGYLLESLDSPARQRVEAELQANPDARVRLAKLQSVLAPLG